MLDLMTTGRGGLFDELLGMQDDWNRLFRTWDKGGDQWGYPPLNVWVSDDDVVVDAELPGVKTDAVDVSVEGDVLTLRGSRVDEEISSDAEVLKRERPQGEFSRALVLPFHVDSEKVKASYRNGVLRVRLPRAESDKPRKVAIEAA